MKIKPAIYFTSALAGVVALLLGPRWIGTELGLALGFTLLLFGIYGISRRVPSRDSENTDKDDL